MKHFPNCNNIFFVFQSIYPLNIMFDIYLPLKSISKTSNKNNSIISYGKQLFIPDSNQNDLKPQSKRPNIDDPVIQ